MESVTEADTEVVETTENSIASRVIGIHHAHHVDHRTPVNSKVQRNLELPFKTYLTTDIQAERHIRGVIIIIVVKDTVINRTSSAEMTISGTITKTDTCRGTHKPVPNSFDIKYPVKRNIGICRGESCPKITKTGSQIQVHSVIEGMLIRKLFVIPTQTTTNGTGLCESDACNGKHDNHCRKNLLHNV